MLKKWLTPLSVAERIGMSVIVLFILGSVLKAGYYTVQYGGSDLRARVVGARLLGTSASPYFYKWKPGDSERILDPNDKPDRLVNGVSAAPGALYVQALFTNLDYPTLRIVWNGFQYLLAASIFLVFLLEKEVSPKSRVYAAGITSLFFMCTSIWFYNIERGQIYILYAFFFCLLYYLFKAGKTWAHFLAGVVLTIAIYSRPTFVVVLIPFLMVMNRWLLAGLAAGALPLSLHFLTHLELWKEYHSAMSLYTGFQPGTPAVVHNFSNDFPSSIEGAINLKSINRDFILGGLSPLTKYIGRFLPLHSSTFYLVLYTGIVLLLSLFSWNNVRKKDPATVLLAGFLLYIISEYIIPAPRGPYNVIQWIFPVMVLLHKERLLAAQVVVVVTGLCLLIGFPYNLPYMHDIGELLLLICLCQFLWNTKKPSSKEITL